MPTPPCSNLFPKSHDQSLCLRTCRPRARHHELFNKVLQRELRAAAHQLTAHEQRLAELRSLMAEALELHQELEIKNQES